MVSKYGDNGGQIYNDKCFNFETNYIDEADGKPRTKDIHLDFGLNYNFALSYFDDELRDQGLDPDNEYKYKGN
jgi:hypothetical protein